MEAEKGHIIGSADGTLLLVHQEAWTPLDELANRIHHPTSGTWTSYKDAEIISVSHKAKTTACQLPIELVQDDVRKQG